MPDKETFQVTELREAQTQEHTHTYVYIYVYTYSDKCVWSAVSKQPPYTESN
jgi:hypothetical protein